MGMRIGSAVVRKLGGRVVVGANPRLPTPGELAAAAVIDWCGRQGFPAPVPEFRFHPTRRWRFDLGFVAEKVAVEFQGGAYTGGRHVRPKGFEDDCEKACLAATLGWRILPVTYRMFHAGKLYDWLGRVLRGRG